MSRPLWCDHAKLRQMAPQRVDRLRPLAYQKIARTEQHPSGLLLFPSSTATKLMVGRCAASVVASASAISFF